MPTNQTVYTYHCTFCSHLIVATTLKLATLPTRQSPGLDHAIIVPLPPPPRNPDDSEDEDDEESDSDAEEEIIEEDATEDQKQSTDSHVHPVGQSEQLGQESGDTSEPEPKKRIKRILPPPKDYTLLLSSAKDRSSRIITREDGFEKRYLWRCGRCRVIIAYQLDEMQYPSDSSDAGGRGLNRKKKKKRKDFIYFLQGALISTEELGRDINEADAEFPGVGDRSSG